MRAVAIAVMLTLAAPAAALTRHPPAKPVKVANVRAIPKPVPAKPARAVKRPKFTKMPPDVRTIKPSKRRD